jgi:5-carboxymethyl-2-hydroxymuconate isomerase
MPHLIIEYSKNLEDQIVMGDLARKVHEAALASGVFEVGAVRTRTEPREVYVIADGHPQNAFVALTVRIASGRSAETRKRLGQTIFDALCDHLAMVYETTPISISLEVQEIDPTAAFKKNNLHALVKQRAGQLRVGEA